jgi:hypothetical protein
MSEWKLTVRFPPLEHQVESDPENLFPNDYVSRSIGVLRKMWYMDSYMYLEEFQEFVSWTEQEIIVTTGPIDSLVGFVEYLMMRTIPESICLTRNGTSCKGKI